MATTHPTTNIRQTNETSASVNPQQLTKDLVEIFKLRVTSLLSNTLILFWPLLAIVVVYSVYPLLGTLGDPYDTVQLVVCLVLLGIFVFYSMPRIGMDRLEKRYWVRKYLSTREVATDEQSRAFIHDNKEKIIAYRGLIFNKYYLIPLLVAFAPLVIMGAIVAQGVLSNTGSQLFAMAFFGLLAGTPVLAGLYLLYWLHTRTVLMFAWERFLDAIENNENIPNEQILKDARRLSKVLGVKGRSRFMSYDFTASVITGAPAAATNLAVSPLPKAISQPIKTYALLYSFNAYQLENLAIVYCFYEEAKAKAAQTNA